MILKTPILLLQLSFVSPYAELLFFGVFFLFGWRVFQFFFMYFTNFLKLFYKTCFMQLSMLHVGCYYLLLVVAISYVKKTVLSTDLYKFKWKYHKKTSPFHTYNCYIARHYLSVYIQHVSKTRRFLTRKTV